MIAPTAPNSVDLLLTENDLAARWRLSPKTLQAARIRGTLVRYVKIGRAVRYRLADVIAYEQTHLQNDLAREARS